MEELYRDKIGPIETQTPIFWNRQGLAPSLPDVLAGPWVKRLKRAEKKTEMDLSTMVKLGLAKSTRLEHQRKLRDLEYLKPLEGEFLVTCLLRYFEEEQKWREWEGSTLCANMASTQGALASLPLYRKGMEPILLKVSPEWRLGLKGAGSLARRRVGTLYIIHTEDCSPKGYQESHENGTKSDYEGGNRVRMGNSVEGRVSNQTEDRECPGGRHGDIGKIRGRQDSFPSTLHDPHHPGVLGDTGLCGKEDEGNRTGVLVVPRFEGRTYQEVFEESGPSVRAEIVEERGDTAPSRWGNEGCGSSSRQPASDNGYPEQVSRIRLVDGGEGGESEEGGRPEFNEEEGGERGRDGNGDGGGKGRGGGGYMGIPRFVKKNFIDPPSWEAKNIQKNRRDTTNPVSPKC